MVKAQGTGYRRLSTEEEIYIEICAPPDIGEGKIRRKIVSIEGKWNKNEKTKYRPGSRVWTQDVYKMKGNDELRTSKNPENTTTKQRTQQ